MGFNQLFRTLSWINCSLSSQSSSTCIESKPYFLYATQR